VPRSILSILGILMFGAILYCGGVEALRQVAEADLFYLGCAFVAAGVGAFLTSVRWGLIVDSLEGRVVHSRLRYFYYVMMGKVSSLFVSQYVGDYAVRPLALTASSSTDFGTAFYSVLLDRLFDLVLSLLFLVPALLYLASIVSEEMMILLIAGVVAVYWLISARNHRILTDSLAAVIGAVERWKAKAPFMESTIERVVEMMEGGRKGLAEVGRKCITAANLLTFGRYLAMALRAYLICLALHLTIPFWVVFLAVGLVRFSLLLAVAPGRLGVLEVGWYGVLALGGVGSATIIPFLIGLRVYSLVFNAVLALGAHVAVTLIPRTAD